ncbi:hypothetical protein PAPYR_5247 [Paratrimastix pyriformis]|uniref:Uncharacterized protein n=1 Tax=Paratrimastix pyriformis TaxID=342808 RepID=A0ABQ8UNR4_9EUKA|nr:hypothetical protein PAPYR_5247 [Paratrimastix pyriformis]
MVRQLYDKRAVIGLVRSGEMRVGQMIRFVGSASPLCVLHEKRLSRGGGRRIISVLMDRLVARVRVPLPCSIQGFLPPEFERLAKRRRDDVKRFPDRYAVEVRGVVASMQLDGKVHYWQAPASGYAWDLVGITLDNTQYRVGAACPHIIPAKACAMTLHRTSFTSWTRYPYPSLVEYFRCGCVGGTDMDATLGTVMPSNERHVHLSLQEHQVDQPAPGALVTPLYTTFIAEIMVRPSRSAGGFPAQAGIKVGYAPRIHVQAGVSTARVLEIFFAKPKPGAPVPPASIADPRNREWMDCLGPEAEAHRSAVEKRWLSGVACLMGMGRAFLELCARSTHEQYDVAQWVPRPARLRVGERGVVRFGLDMPMFMDLYRSYVMRADAIPDPRTRAPSGAQQAATSSPFGVFVLTNGRDLVGLGKVIAFD